MNHLQEALLDQFMVADKIGNHNWDTGILKIALEVLRTAGLTRRKDAGRALGYPPLLCAALEGASQVLIDADERRQLAISIFTEVPPRSTMPRLNRLEHVEMALWSVRRVAAWYDKVPALTDEVDALLAAYLTGEQADVGAIDRLSRELQKAMNEVDAPCENFTTAKIAVQPFYFALHVLRRSQKNEWTDELTAWVTRNVARLAALVKGLEGAVPFCLELARTLGM